MRIYVFLIMSVFFSASASADSCISEIYKVKESIDGLTKVIDSSNMSTRNAAKYIREVSSFVRSMKRSQRYSVANALSDASSQFSNEESNLNNSRNQWLEYAEVSMANLEDCINRIQTSDE